MRPAEYPHRTINDILERAAKSLAERTRMPSNNEPTKASVPPSPTSSEAVEDQVLTKEQKARALEVLKRLVPSVIAKPKAKKPIPRHVN